MNFSPGLLQPISSISDSLLDHLYDDILLHNLGFISVYKCRRPVGMSIYFPFHSRNLFIYIKIFTLTKVGLKLPLNYSQMGQFTTTALLYSWLLYLKLLIMTLKIKLHILFQPKAEVSSLGEESAKGHYRLIF